MDLFRGRKIVIATMHGKEQVIAPLVQDALGVVVVIPDNFNTDVYGTFSGETKRDGDQLEAARKKGYAAMELTQTDMAIASEGSFGMHPSIPFIQSNLELVLFIDKKNGLEIRGHYSTSEVNSGGEYISSVADAVSFAQKHNFPQTGVVLKYRESGMYKVYKNISTIEDLVYRVEKMLSHPFVRKIFIETDMRAHKNPVRMNAIEQATKDLLKNINSLCPQCGAPGFVVSDVQLGLVCDVCLLPTDLPVSEIYTCVVCAHSQSNMVASQKTTMTSVFCKHCNP